MTVWVPYYELLVVDGMEADVDEQPAELREKGWVETWFLWQRVPSQKISCSWSTQVLRRQLSFAKLEAYRKQVSSHRSFPSLFLVRASNS